LPLVTREIDVTEPGTFAMSFALLEATIDEIHAAYRSGLLTVRELERASRATTCQPVSHSSDAPTMTAT
jgi:hypothetical protein